MASIYPIMMTLAVFSIFGNILAGQPFPENNPQLGIYQNEADCFPLDDTWYLMYRSFENDPYFGGSPMCVAVSASGPFENGSGKVKVQFGGKETVEITNTLMSSPGYEVLNVINVVPVADPEVNVNVTCIYRDCESCKVLRHTYADGGQGCAVWQPKRAIGKNVTCCHFVYDLLCGASKKYQCYEKCEQ
ncbi:uncharacterized protein LOC144146863 [Haemaphysalis longicornis]